MGLTREQKANRALGLCASGLHAWVEENLLVNSRGNAQCKHCHRASSAAYKRANPEKAKAWGKRNPERRREIARRSQAKSYAANPEKHRAQARKAWAKAYAEDPQRFRDQARQAVHKRRAALLESGAFDVSPKDRRRLAAQPCAHAHYGPCSGRMEEDHIVPISRGGSHGIGNLQMLCRFHNGSKNNRLEIEVRGK